MTHHLDELAAPRTDGLTRRDRQYLAYELTFVAEAVRERAGVLYRADAGRLAAAITELTELAARISQRARRYQHA